MLPTVFFLVYIQSFMLFWSLLTHANCLSRCSFFWLLRVSFFLWCLLVSIGVLCGAQVTKKRSCLSYCLYSILISYLGELFPFISWFFRGAIYIYTHTHAHIQTHIHTQIHGGYMTVSHTHTYIRSKSFLLAGSRFSCLFSCLSTHTNIGW